VEEGQISILRIAEPELDMERRLVTVYLKILAEDRSSGKRRKIKEVHPMRYFYPPEIAMFAGWWLRSQFRDQPQKSPGTFAVRWRPPPSESFTSSYPGDDFIPASNPAGVRQS
jgi:hypothetical protein